MRIRYSKYWWLAVAVVFISLSYSCANMASPNGGPYDEAPPKFVSSTPVPNQLNYKGKKVEILFDELIKVDNPLENVVVTPPQKSQPVVQANGRRVTVELEDSLLENTTYTIDFTNSISDNNEGNVFQNFSFAFSTGPTIDSLEVSGVVLNAENLEPMPGITIGIHTNLEDSAFLKIPFVRTSRTNDRGEFTIRNIATGTYRIYALNDALRSYMHNQPGQEIAYANSLVVPTFEFSTRQDTIWKDTLTIDTIKTVNYTHFMPDNIVLRLFKEKFDRQYMLRPERPTDRMLVVRFNAPLDTLPELTPVNFEPVDSAWYFVQRLEENRAANLWLIDSTVWKQDTLRFSMTYPKSDSLNILRPQIDTLQFLAPRKRGEEKKKKRKEDEPEPIEFLGMSVTNTSGSINLFDTVAVTFAEPVLELDSSRFRLERMIDSVWVLTDFRFFPDTANSLNFYIMRDWKYGENYRLTIDSATIYSAYGKWNDFFAGDFSIKKAEEYGHLYINTPGVEGPAFVELLNSSDTPVRRVPVKDGGALFMDLKPDKYYARMILDTNGNGRWDTGDYTAKRQPEEVFYCPKMFNIMQNWEVEETWDIKALPLKRQKPMDITKNKPKEITKPKRDYRNEGKSSSSSSNSMRGLSF